MNNIILVRFSLLYGSCEKFQAYQGKFLIVFKLTALDYFIIKGMRLFPLFLRILVPYNQGDGDTTPLLMTLDSRLLILYS